MKFVPIASSSKGNAYVLEYDGVALLIDNGLTYRTLKAKYPALDSILAVLITHSHVDHTKGLSTFLSHHCETPIYANSMTAETIASQEGIDESAFVCFENGQEFEIGPFVVRAFSIPHDTSDPVGYLIKAGGEAYFHGTDIGTPLDSIGIKFAEADIATLESNHDLVMLNTSGRAPCLIQRISGPRGHLSNDQSADFVRRFASPKLRELNLAHLSQDCNSPHLAESTMLTALASINRSDITLNILTP